MWDMLYERKHMIVYECLECGSLFAAPETWESIPLLHKAMEIHEEFCPWTRIGIRRIREVERRKTA